MLGWELYFLIRQICEAGRLLSFLFVFWQEEGQGLVGPAIETSDLNVPGKCSTTELHPQLSQSRALKVLLEFEKNL